MFMLEKRLWSLFALALSLSSVVVFTDVEAAIEITPTLENQKKLIVTEPIINAPKPLQQKKLRTRSMPGAKTIKAGLKNLIVNGYKDNVFVYGKLKSMPGGEIEGYLYSDNQSIYVYGKLHKKEQVIQAHDATGQLYLLEIVKK